MNSKKIQDIIVKEADKGSAIKIMNKMYYQNKMLEMVMDKSTYETIKNNEDRTIVNKIKRLCPVSYTHLTLPTKRIV